MQMFAAFRNSATFLAGNCDLYISRNVRLINESLKSRKIVALSQKLTLSIHYTAIM